MTEPTHPVTCQCKGTGTVSGVVLLAGAVLIRDRPCPEGEPPRQPNRRERCAARKGGRR